VFYTLTTAVIAVEDILAEAESGDLSLLTISNETIHSLRAALYDLQAEEANEEQFELDLNAD
jgi:hypothetical protein